MKPALEFAQEALGCTRRSTNVEEWIGDYRSKTWHKVKPVVECRTHSPAWPWSGSWPCPKALALAALIEARDREIRADELEAAAKLVTQRTNAGNADIGPDGRRKERRAIARLLRERAEAVIASLRDDLASGDPERVRETADALGLTVSPMAVVGGTSWSVRGTSWYEPRKRDTLVPHDHTQRVPGCFRCDMSSLKAPDA